MLPWHVGLGWHGIVFSSSAPKMMMSSEFGAKFSCGNWFLALYWVELDAVGCKLDKVRASIQSSYTPTCEVGCDHIAELYCERQRNLVWMGLACLDDLPEVKQGKVCVVVISPVGNALLMFCSFVAVYSLAKDCSFVE